MTKFKNIFAFIAALLPVVSAKHYSICGSKEEGQIHNLTCGPVTSTTYLEYGHYNTPVSCNVTQNYCDIPRHNGFLDYSLTTDGLLNVYTNAVNKAQPYFGCRFSDHTYSSCKIDVFVNPAKPKCFDPEVSRYRKYLKVRCMTETVYPSALCDFQYKMDYDVEHVLDGDIFYKTELSKVSLGNKATECTLIIPMSSLTRRFYQFRVGMRADSSGTFNQPQYNSTSDYTGNFDTVTYKIVGGRKMRSPYKVPKHFGAPITGTFKEGEIGNVSCYCSTDFKRRSLTLQLYHYGTFTDVVTCYGSTPPGECQVLYPPGVTSHFWQRNDNHVQLDVTFSMDIRYRFFRCLVDKSMILNTFQLEIYVNPDVITCHAPYFSSDNQFVIVSCRTDHVIPGALCKFVENGTNIAPRGEIFYLNSYFQMKKRIRSRSTNCTVMIPKSTLSNGSHSFFVVMRADICSVGHCNTRETFHSAVTPAITIGEGHEDSSSTTSSVLTDGSHVKPPVVTDSSPNTSSILNDGSHVTSPNVTGDSVTDNPVKSTMTTVFSTLRFPIIYNSSPVTTSATTRSTTSSIITDGSQVKLPNVTEGSIVRQIVTDSPVKSTMTTVFSTIRFPIFYNRTPVTTSATTRPTTSSTITDV